MSRRQGQPKFSTLWKNIFHSVEKSRKSFPYRGKQGMGEGRYGNRRFQVMRAIKLAMTQ